LPIITLYALPFSPPLAACLLWTILYVNESKSENHILCFNISIIYFSSTEPFAWDVLVGYKYP
jgi:hypothetical protein